MRYRSPTRRAPEWLHGPTTTRLFCASSSRCHRLCRRRTEARAACCSRGACCDSGHRVARHSRVRCVADSRGAWRSKLRSRRGDIQVARSFARGALSTTRSNSRSHSSSRRQWRSRARLLMRVREHVGAVRALLSRALAPTPTSTNRARRRFADVRARHPGEKVLVFSQYTDTVLALFAELRGARGVAALTSRGGRIASGATFATGDLRAIRSASDGGGAAAPPPRRSTYSSPPISASEGLNLHDASVVVHMDLPWTPARLEQRVARSRRLGALHARTHSYALAPPADAEMVLSVERRLREKLRTMEEVIGSTGAVLPEGPDVERGTAATANRAAREFAKCIHRTLRAWSAGDLSLGRAARERGDDARSSAADSSPASRPTRSVVLALALCSGRPILAAALDRRELTEDARIVLAATELLSGHDAASRRWRARGRHRACGAMARAPHRSACRGSARVARRLAPHRAPTHRRALGPRAPPQARAHRSARDGRAARGELRPTRWARSECSTSSRALRCPTKRGCARSRRSGRCTGARESENEEATLVAVIIAG